MASLLHGPVSHFHRPRHPRRLRIQEGDEIAGRVQRHRQRKGIISFPLKCLA
jgi:hypothetical protein